MALSKSLDDSYNLIAAALVDVHRTHKVWFNSRSLKNTKGKVYKRLLSEGIGFLTKTMPRLGKAFDKAISGAQPLNCVELGFKPQVNDTKLPSFLGEFFNRVLQQDGTLLQTPCATSVRVIRQLLYLFYKYELPYTHEQEQQVVSKFEKTESDLSTLRPKLQEIGAMVADTHSLRRVWAPFNGTHQAQAGVIREARILLNRLFAFFDPSDITPRHGPGAVATKQQLWDKYLWVNISAKITEVYPLDAYFFASLGHVCDTPNTLMRLGQETLPARVILVPKDSRGPRLISCEPVDFQWVQQGLGAAIVELVEKHDTTRYNVHFTDQSPNRYGALLGSTRDRAYAEAGRYSTLDLNEASDRVSTELVRLLFPEHLFRYLEACRSTCTQLPDGRVIELQKFAPMGSALCFPILALVIWALLSGGAPDQDTMDSILVYGDDVIVPTAFAENAMSILESFGLKINRDKSCTSGLFRESCGMDAFNGIDVTPVRLRTVWEPSPSAGVYTSWIAYANSFWDRQYYCVYNLIVDRLLLVYGSIPDDDMVSKSCPSLRCVPEYSKPKQTRINHFLQKREWRVWDVKAPSIRKEIGGWSMLLRYFTEAGRARRSFSSDGVNTAQRLPFEGIEAFTASQYTSRRKSKLVRRWR